MQSPLVPGSPGFAHDFAGAAESAYGPKSAAGKDSLYGPKTAAKSASTDGTYGPKGQNAATESHYGSKKDITAPADANPYGPKAGGKKENPYGKKPVKDKEESVYGSARPAGAGSSFRGNEQYGGVNASSGPSYGSSIADKRESESYANTQVRQTHRYLQSINKYETYVIKIIIILFPKTFGCCLPMCSPSHFFLLLRLFSPLSSRSILPAPLLFRHPRDSSSFFLKNLVSSFV